MPLLVNLEEPELKKCNRFQSLNCLKKAGTRECIQAVMNGEADAITLDGGDIFTAGLKPYNLHPILAEHYAKETCYYAVAVAKKGTMFDFNDLHGKKTCHTVLGKIAGWYIPIGALIKNGQIKWAGIEDQPLEDGSVFVSQDKGLFSSVGPERNLMFKDSTTELTRLPELTTHSIHSLMSENTASESSQAIKWCTVGVCQRDKCDSWSTRALEQGNSRLQCETAATVQDCIIAILLADAVAVDGGEVYTAGKCGLVPVMVEQYDAGDTPSYWSVAVVHKSSGVTWKNLKDKKSCHTAVGQFAGWNIPMGLLHEKYKSCDFSSYFSESCAPGSDPASNLCKLCKGDNTGKKGKATYDEPYYGFDGAFRCVAEGAGDVAFVKHTTAIDNTDGRGPGSRRHHSCRKTRRGGVVPQGPAGEVWIFWLRPFVQDF
ncbi:serotransferrin-2-like [Tachysurus ichikawai]